MNLLSLEYFLVAADEMNFTKAASKLYVTQQSLSGHIRKLEEYFGCVLFDRGPPLSLTKEGEGLQQAARKLLIAAADVERQIQDIKDLRNGEITIGITRVRSNIYLPPILTKFHEKYTNVRINIVEGSTPEIESALHKAKIDLEIGFIPLDCEDVTSIPFWEEKTVLVVPQKILIQYFPTDYKQILGGEKYLTLKDLQYCPFVAMDKELLAGREFRMSCIAQGFTPNIVVSAKSLSALIPLCLHSIGVLVCPEVFLLPYREQLALQQESGVKVFPTHEVALPNIMCVNYLKNRYMSPIIEEFLRILQKETTLLKWNLFPLS